MQEGTEGMDHSITFVSPWLSKAKRAILPLSVKGWKWYTRSRNTDTIYLAGTSRCILIILRWTPSEQACVGGHIWKLLLLFQEYDFEVIVKLGCLNLGPDHLSWIETGEETTNLEEGLPDAQIFAVRIANGHFEDIIIF